MCYRFFCPEKLIEVLLISLRSGLNVYLILEAFILVVFLSYETVGRLNEQVRGRGDNM